MGCDIHVNVEVRRGDTWHLLPFDAIEQPFRNYATFAILGDVRNGDFNFIGSNRGLPSDASRDWSEVYKDECDNDYSSLHSWSWVTLRELMEFDWEQLTESTREPYFEKTGPWFNIGFVGQLHNIADDVGGPDNVRIVFFFDN